TDRQLVLVQPPRLKEMNDILKDIEAASLRVGATIAIVRELFKEAADQPTKMCIEDVARQALRLLQHELQFNEISVVTELLAAPPSVSADPAQLQLVILNLIKNAIEAMNSVPVGNRRLNVSTRFGENSYVLLSVQDTGAGIHPQNQSRILEAF